MPMMEVIRSIWRRDTHTHDMNRAGKEVDTTYLSLDTAEERGFIHRDYIAHCMRWSHVVKRLTQGKAYETARILDVGCGRELPLAKLLYSSRLIPQAYIGVDYGPIPDESLAPFHTGKFPIEVYDRTDVCALTIEELGSPVTHVTCFEMLEHIEPAHVRRVLNHLKTLLHPDGTAWFSTPCWDVVSCAGNHVNEMRYEALGMLFEKMGWTIVDVHGTFASIRDYEQHLSVEHRKTFDDMRAYYDVNFLACVFAPFYPAQSRNCLWEVVPKRTDPEKRMFTEHITEPHTSSTRWRELLLDT